MKKTELYKILLEAVDETAKACPAPTQDVSENGIFFTLPFECVQNSSTEALKISLFSGTAIGSM